MSDLKVFRFTGDEIIRALLPEIKRQLAAEHGFVSFTPIEYELLLTRWETKARKYTGKLPLPPGTRGLTVDVEITLARRADLEGS